MVNKHPKLRSHARRRKSGRVVIYYAYDMRGTGQPDIGLGTDYEQAIKKWDEIHNLRPRIVGTLMEAFEAWEAEVLPSYTNTNTRKDYARHLRRLKPAFGAATWDGVMMADLKRYLKSRTGKTQANRELAVLSIIWNWARTEGYTDLAWPAAGMERSGWKNKEKAREFEVTDALFDAVYAEADQVLKDAMDIATATGYRVTDVRLVPMPTDGILRSVAHKTGKRAQFEVAQSPVLTAIVARRQTIRADHVMLLSTRTGRPVSYSMLRARWDAAREAAAKKAAENGDAELAGRIRAMYLRDMRKRASDLADSDESASKLLQHSSVGLTRKHYRSRATKLKPVR